jgi:hypothetical protein
LVFGFIANIAQLVTFLSFNSSRVLFNISFAYHCKSESIVTEISPCPTGIPLDKREILFVT